MASDDDGVSKDLEFPAGDCRNGTTATRVTDEQISHLMREFDQTVYPRLTTKLGVHLSRRAGENPLIREQFPEIPPDAYAGDPARVVILVDNPHTEGFFNEGPSGLLGYVNPASREQFDRHVLTLNGTFWDQQLGRDPQQPPALPPGCPAALPVPQFMEYVLAHEFVHVLEFDRIVDDANWLTEGLADWGAFTLGYVHADDNEPLSGNSHIRCFLGITQFCGDGPENSMTLWGDGANTATDYGAAASFMMALEAAAGVRPLRALLSDPAWGLESLRGILAAHRVGRTDQDLLQEWSTMIALDAALDDGAALAGAPAGTFQSPRLHAMVGWDNPASYLRPGAPANGSDFVRLRDASGTPLSSGQIERVDFAAAPTLQPAPVWWASEDGALRIWSPAESDDAIVREVEVDPADPVLTFRTRYDTEPGWDFGFVQVSTDGGATFRSLPATSTTSQTAAPEIDPRVAAHLPGFTGDSGGWREERVDLSAYAGRSVLLSFRYITDQLFEFPGWWVDDVVVSGRTISDGTTLAGWRSLEQIRPLPVGGMRVRLVGYTDDRRRAFVRDLPLDAGLRGTLSGEQLREAAGGADVQTVAAIVSHYEPRDTTYQVARYALTVDGVTQGGG